MTTIYTDLRERVKTIAKNDLDYRLLSNLVTRHFEGERVWELMPDDLRIIVTAWENEQYGLD